VDNLNFSDFLRVAVRLGSVNPNHYVTGIQVGHEIYGGVGKARTSLFRVDWGTNVEQRVMASNEIQAGRQMRPIFAVGQMPIAKQLVNGTKLNNIYDIRGRTFVQSVNPMTAQGVYLLAR